MADNVVSSNYIDFTGRVKGNGFQQLNKQIMSSHRNLFSLGNMLRAFFGYDLYSSVRNLIPELVHTSQLLGAMKSRFNAVSTSASAGADELNWVGEQSKRLGLDFLRTADDYSIFFATVSKNMGQGTTRKVFEQWAEAFRVLHIDPERQTRVLYALREMSSKGKIYMQDLALQLGSAVPDAMNIAAKSMGYIGPKAVERFRKAIKDGAVDVKKFIPLFSEAVNKQYVSQNALNYAMGQTDAQLQLINTHFQFLQKNLLESGFQDDIVNFLKTANKLLGFLEKHASGLYKAIKAIVGLVLTIAGLRGLNFLIVKLPILLTKLPIIFANATAFFIFLESIIMKLIGASAWKFLFRIIGGALGLLNNPVGWTILVGIIISGVVKIADLILKKFFPDVREKLFIMSQDFKMWFLESIWAITDAWNKSPMGKVWHMQTEADKQPIGLDPSINTSNMNDKNSWMIPKPQFRPPNAPVNASGKLSVQNIFRPNTTIHMQIESGNSSPEDVGNIVMDKLNELKGKEKIEFARQVINSRVDNRNPFGLLLPQY